MFSYMGVNIMPVFQTQFHSNLNIGQNHNNDLKIKTYMKIKLDNYAICISH